MVQHGMVEILKQSGRRKSTIMDPDFSHAHLVLHLRGALWMDIAKVLRAFKQQIPFSDLEC